LELPLWNVDPDLLRQCLNTVVRRHEILRTTFHVDGHRPVQVVAPALELDMPVIDLSGQPEEAQRAEYQRICALAAGHRFDLETGPLVTATLVRLDGAACSLVIVADHIVFDGWSVGVLFRELAVLYEASMRGLAAPLAPLPIQYGEHAETTRASLQGDRLKQHEDFWKAELQGIPTRIELPLDRPRQNGAGNSPGAFQFFELPEDVASKLRALAQLQQTTTFTVLLAAFQTLLWRYTREDTVVVGSPVANREQSGVQALIGFFVNMLILRADFSNGLTFRQLLGQVRQTAIEAYEHQELPFEKLIEELQPERDLSINPIFQVMFALHHVGRVPAATASRSAVDGHGAKFDLSLHFTDDQQAFKGTFEYRTALFESSTIERMAGHLVRLLAHVIEHLDAPLAHAALLTEAEQEVLRQCHRTSAVYDTTACVHDLFAAQAARTPHAVAVVFEDHQLTYAELDRQSTHVALRLRALGIRDERLVGVCMERSLNFMVAIVGVLKAGGVYVPLDPEYPDERLRLIIRDAALAVALTDEPVVDRLAASGAELLRVADCVQDGEPAERLPHVTAEARNAVYVIYTSGSTGAPKGAINTHQALTNRLLWMQDTFRLTPRDRVLHKTSIGFDVSVWELLWPIITGAAVILAAPGRQRDAGYLAKAIASSGVTHVHFVPSMLQAFLAEAGPLALPSLRCVIASGEELSAALQQHFFERIGSCALENLYGPTEAAIDVTRWACRLDPARRTVPIGHAIANTRLYVLDRNLNELPIGIVGELYIAGIAPARGYLRRGALTAERFLPDPIGNEPGGRMYRTGDLGRRLPGGEIEYLGRIDDQVKLRGARIELGEIRAALLRHPGVRDAVVVVDGVNGTSERRLIGYYVRRPDHDVAVHEVRRRLQETLPSYMVPSAYVELEAIPLTQNGKLDRKALPKPDRSRALADEPIAPADPLQVLIVSLWGEILRVGAVGIEDNFFDLGGHSLLALQVLSRLRAALDVDIPASRFFNAPTPALLAAEILRGADDAAMIQTRAQAVMTITNLSDEEVSLMLRKLGDASTAKEGAT
jgi:amino acid adenylation domain-containing protein